MKIRKNEGYGLVTLISTVIGTVIGSGIFFKSEEILEITKGNVLLGLLAFAVGGGIMLVCAGTFALLSAKEKCEGGVVGYAEKMCGGGFARFTALFSAIFYLPSMTATLALVGAEYFCRLIGQGCTPALKIAVAGAFLALFFSVNTFTPSFAGRFQVASTALKLLPLFAIGAVGCVMLAGEGIPPSKIGSGGGFMPALLSVAFAYEGWIAVTSLGGDVKNPKRSLPLALMIGSVTVIGVYVFYFLGVIGADRGGDSANAFKSVFGEAGGRMMLAFVVVSCLGALNGLSMSTLRSQRLLKEYLARGSESSNVERQNYGAKGLLVSQAWMIVCLLCEGGRIFSGIDPAEASISVMYGIYAIIFLMMTRKCRELTVVKRYVLPFFAVTASVFVALSSPVAFGIPMLWFLIAAAAISIAVLLNYYRGSGHFRSNSD